MPIVIVDRNVVSLCRRKLNGQKLNPYQTRELRKLNSSINFISPLYSIIEGSHGNKESYEQKLKTLKDEAQIIKKFFDRAETDSEYLISSQEEAAKLFSKHSIEENEENYKKFIAEMYPILFQPIKRTERKNTQEKILNIAINYNMDIKHFLVLCSLGVLYGNNKVRKIFHFTNEFDEKDIEHRAYNTYHDLMIINRIDRLRELRKKNNPRDKIVYFTFDKELNSLINSVKSETISYEEKNNSYLHEHTMTLKKGFFPDLSDEEVSQLEISLLNHQLQN